eukprot:1028609-Pyramimonas_sp.AAC.1
MSVHSIGCNMLARDDLPLLVGGPRLGRGGEFPDLRRVLQRDPRVEERLPEPPLRGARGGDGAAGLARRERGLQPGELQRLRG